MAPENVEDEGIETDRSVQGKKVVSLRYSSGATCLAGRVFITAFLELPQRHCVLNIFILSINHFQMIIGEPVGGWCVCYRHSIGGVEVRTTCGRGGERCALKYR